MLGSDAGFPAGTPGQDAGRSRWACSAGGTFCPRQFLNPWRLGEKGGGALQHCSPVFLLPPTPELSTPYGPTHSFESRGRGDRSLVLSAIRLGPHHEQSHGSPAK